MRQLNVQKALALELRMGEPIELPSKRAVNLTRIFDELDLGVERIEAAIEEASPEAIARWPLDAESAGSEGGSRMVESAKTPPPGAIRSGGRSCARVRTRDQESLVADQ